MIIPVTDLGETPASVNRQTGDIFLNCKIWNKIPENEQKFILEHEKGHFHLNTSNEIKADNYAFSQYAGREKYSLKGILHAIGDRLDIENNPSHKKRYLNIVKKILQYDALNGNEKAKQILKKMEIQNKIDKLPSKTYKLLMSMLVGFLKNKGIRSIQSIPENQRVELFKEFFQTQQVLYLLRKTAEQNDSFLGMKKGWFGSVLTGAASAVGAAFGIPPAVTTGAIGLVSRVIGGSHSHSSAPDLDTTAWNTAKQGGQMSSYKAYLSQYPSGRYAAQAKAAIKAIDDRAYKTAVSGNSIASFQAYLSKYPSGGHVSQAKAAIKAIDDKAYQTAVSGNSIASFQAYISQYPTGGHVAEANAKIAAIKKKKNTFIFAGIGTGIVILIVIFTILKR